MGFGIRDSGFGILDLRFGIRDSGFGIRGVHACSSAARCFSFSSARSLPFVKRWFTLWFCGYEVMSLELMTFSSLGLLAFSFRMGKENYNTNGVPLLAPTLNPLPSTLNPLPSPLNPQSPDLNPSTLNPQCSNLAFSFAASAASSLACFSACFSAFFS